MNTLIKQTNSMGSLFRDTRDTFFSRSIDDVLKYNFFNSLDANIHEDENGYRLEIAVPGMRRKDINLQIEGSLMRVSARKQQENNLGNTIEFNRSLFQRSFILPEDVDAKHIKAKCRDGLLTIQIEKTNDKRVYHTIKVHGEDRKERLTDNIISWWHRMKHKVIQLLNRQTSFKSQI